jgi:hypothetical protein
MLLAHLAVLGEGTNEAHRVFQKPAYRLDHQEAEYLKAKGELIRIGHAYTNQMAAENKRILRGGVSVPASSPSSFSSSVVRPYADASSRINRRLAIMEDDRPDLKELSNRIARFNATSAPVWVTVTNSAPSRKAQLDEAVRKFREEQSHAAESGSR